MSKNKFTPDQALNVLIQAADIAIKQGAFDRKQVVDIDKAIETFTAQAIAEGEPDSDPPHDPSRPKP